MRQVLVEAARRRHAGQARRRRACRCVTLDESVADPAEPPANCSRSTTALDELARLHPRQAAIVENRFFGGLDVAETAGLLGRVGSHGAARLARARAWLPRNCARAG